MTDTPSPVTGVMKIRLRRIKAGSLFKLVLLASGTIFIPMILFFGVLALFGANTVTLSGKPVTGIMGLVTAVIMAPFFTLFFAVFLWVGAYLGIRLWGFFKPLVIEYVPAEQDSA